MLQRKKRTHVRDAAESAFAGQPKSFVLRRGRYGSMLKELEKDLRQTMLPNTAKSLKVRGCCGGYYAKAAKPILPVFSGGVVPAEVESGDSPEALVAPKAHI